MERRAIKRTLRGNIKTFLLHNPCAPATVLFIVAVIYLAFELIRNFYLT